MEYLDLIEKFWQLTDEIPINSSVVSTYFLLLERWDKSGKTDFEYPDKLIQKKIRIDRKTIKINKEILRNLGLISYQVTMGFPTVYKIIPDYVIRNRKGKEVTSTAEKEKTPAKVVQQELVPSVSNIEVLVKAPEIPKVNLSENIPINTQNEIEKTSIQKKTKTVQSKLKDIPTYDEFLEFAKTIPIYNPSLDEHIKNKYDTWYSNGWVNGYDKPITNWKQTLKNTLPYLKSQNNNIFNIPNITRPKATYDE